MVLRWASALLMTEKNFCRLMAYQDLWVLKAASGRNQEGSNQRRRRINQRGSDSGLQMC